MRACVHVCVRACVYDIIMSVPVHCVAHNYFVMEKYFMNLAKDT